MRALTMQGAAVDPSVGTLTSFVGGFHPVVVHLPIGIFALAVGLELLASRARFRPAVDAAQSLVLGAATASAALAFVLGVALGAEGGYPASLLERHRAFASATIVGVAATGVAWWAHRKRGVSRLVPRTAMGLTLIAIVATGHLGGSLSRGEGHLLASAPPAVQRLFGAEVEAAPSSSAGPVGNEPLLFDDVVRPLLEARCVSCHGPTRAKGRLRLDDLDALRRGGTSGPAFVAGHAARSLLVARLHLAPTDAKHMPPEGEEPLTDGEIAVIGFWIDRGARTDLRVRDALAPTTARSLLEATVSRAATPPPPAAAPPAGDPSVAGPAPAPSSPASTPATPASAAVATVAPRSPPPTWSAVRDVLERRCARCHGPREQQGDLRVDSLEALERGGDGGPALVRGRPGAGTLLARIQRPLDDAEHMPPSDEPQLTPAELQLVTAFVRGLSARGAATAVASVDASAPPSPGESADPTAAPSARREPAAAAEPGELATGAPPVAAPAGDRPAATPRPPPAPTGGCLSCAVGSDHASSSRPAIAGWLAGLLLAALRRRPARRV